MKTTRSLLVLLLLGSGACVAPAPLTDRACPCADGWKCCDGANVCVPEDTGTCPTPDPGPPQRIDLEEAAVDDRFGEAVSIAGTVAAVGVPGRDTAIGDGGAVILYERRGDDATWIRLAELTSPTPEARAGFGTAVAFAGDRLLVGAPREASGQGRVHVFTHGANGWEWSATIVPELADVPADSWPYTGFGGQVIADGARTVISTNLGWADVYDLAGANAAHRVRLRAPEGEGLKTWSSETLLTIHGTSVVAISDGEYPSPGAAHVFDELDGWTPVRVSDLPRNPIHATPALRGNRLAIACDYGRVCVHERGAGGWGSAQTVTYTEETPTVSDRATALAWLDDGHVAVTTKTSDGIGLYAVWQLPNGSWVGQFALDAGELADATPSAVSVSDRWMLVGMPSATDAGQDAGAVDLLHIDIGIFERIRITLDEGSLADESIISGGRNLIAASRDDESHQLFWFQRDADGAYIRRPSLILSQPYRASVVPGGLAVDDLTAVIRLAAGLQMFELGDHDWTVGPLITPPDENVAFARSVAIDGDVMVISASDAGTFPDPVALVYERTAAGWTNTARLRAANCGVAAPNVAIDGDKILVECGGPFPVALWMFTRAGTEWVSMPAPELPEPLGGGVYESSLRTVLSGDRLALAWQSVLSPKTANIQNVFRWQGDQWELELTHRFALPEGETCATGCRSLKVLALEGNRLVLGRDPTSVASYAFDGTTWVEDAVFALPAQTRSTEAEIQKAMLVNDRLLLSVPHEAGRLTDSGAVYSFTWR